MQDSKPPIGTPKTTARANGTSIANCTQSDTDFTISSYADTNVSII